MRLSDPPLSNRYGPTLAMVLLALCPDIIVTTAYDLLQPQLVAQFHAAKETLFVGNALSNAGYAFGAIVGGFLTQRYVQRRLFLSCEALFVVGCLLAAVANGAVVFSAGRIVQGLATGLLLVIALPPLVTSFPAAKLPITAAAIDIGFFGATTAGPLVAGGLVATGTWRWFFVALALAGVAGFVLGLFSLRAEDPPDPERTARPSLFVLAALGTGLPFFGVSTLTGGSWSSPLFFVPLAIGLAALVALIVQQYHHEDALVPVRPLTSALPLAGTIVAMVAGAAFVSFLVLSELFLTKVQGHSPLVAGLTFWPQVLGMALAASLFGALFRTRHLPLFVLVGLLLLLAGGGALVTLHVGTSSVTVLAAAGALGFGAGATVSPGLWVAALAVPSTLVGRAFALVELVRSVADFVITPVLTHIAQSAGTSPVALAGGIRRANWIMAAILFAGIVTVAGIYLSSGQRPERPDLDAYIDDGEPALASPAPAAALRS